MKKLISAYASPALLVGAAVYVATQYARNALAITPELRLMQAREQVARWVATLDATGRQVLLANPELLQKATDFFFYAVNALWPCFVMVIGTFVSFGLVMMNRKIIINHKIK